MDRHIPEFYHHSYDGASASKFHEVILLDHTSPLEWPDVIAKVPSFPRGWFELAHLVSEDRIDFTFSYWQKKLPYNIRLSKSLENFFAALDDIAIFLIQKKSDEPFKAEMVYSIEDNGGFYRGGLPAQEEPIERLKKAFADFILPKDYLAFLQIHDGWWKTTDCTGLLCAEQVPNVYQELQNLLKEDHSLTTQSGMSVDPKKLIPFYKSFGMPYYQCFWAQWFPENEMGNVYYSSANKCISDQASRDGVFDTMSFPTFSDWLAFYMERVD